MHPKKKETIYEITPKKKPTKKIIRKKNYKRKGAICDELHEELKNYARTPTLNFLEKKYGVSRSTMSIYLKEIIYENPNEE